MNLSNFHTISFLNRSTPTNVSPRIIFGATKVPMAFGMYSYKALSISVCLGYLMAIYMYLWHLVNTAVTVRFLYTGAVVSFMVFFVVLLAFYGIYREKSSLLTPLLVFQTVFCIFLALCLILMDYSEELSTPETIRKALIVMKMIALTIVQLYATHIIYALRYYFMIKKEEAIGYARLAEALSDVQENVIFDKTDSLLGTSRTKESTFVH